MDIIFMAFGIAGTLLTTIICLIALTDLRHTGAKEVLTVAGIMWCISILFVIWSGMAMHTHRPSPIVTTHPIEVKYNTPYFFGPKNEVHELTGNNRFVDVEKFHVKWVVVPGGWEYGMYVTEDIDWNIVSKVQVEATH